MDNKILHPKDLCLRRGHYATHTSIVNQINDCGIRLTLNSLTGFFDNETDKDNDTGYLIGSRN